MRNETNKPIGAQELTDKELEGVVGGQPAPLPSEVAVKTYATHR